MGSAISQPHQRLFPPQVAKVEASRPLRWLHRGWKDLTHNPGASLAHGLLLTTMGLLVLWLASSSPSLFMAAVSGLLLGGPLMATGFYELSRRRAAGEPTSFDASFDGLQKNGRELGKLGLVLGMFAILWGMLSAFMWSQVLGNTTTATPVSLYNTIFDWHYSAFLGGYVFVGGILALIVFVLSAVAGPMIIDRSTDCMTAMITSVRAVSVNLGAMAVWAFLIVTLTAIGLATFMLGLIVVIPWLGHATWHAYKDVVSQA